MTTVYVNTASVGGDGTTNATSGANAAYVSLRQAILGEAANRTGLGDLEILCDGGLDDEFIAAADWSGWTTTASDRIIVKTNPANANAPLTVDYTKYHFGEVGTWSGQGTTGTLIEVGDGTQVINIKFSIQFRRDIASYNSGTTRRIMNQRENTYIEWNGCIFDIRGSDNAGSGTVRCVESPTSGAFGAQCFNSLFLGDQTTSTGGHTAFENTFLFAATRECYNNLFIGFDTAAENGGTNYIANNCFQDCVTELVDATPDSNVRYNLTDNASFNSSGTGDLVSKTLTFVGSGDYNLLDNTTGANADVIGAGIGPSADANVPTLDAYGNTRSGATSDLLPYEYALASPSPTYTITSIDGDNNVQAGQTNVSIVTSGIDPASVTQAVTLGGETLTINSWTDSGGNALINVDIPLHINAEWGTTHELAVTHDGGTTTLSGVTLSAPTGWETVSFATIPDTGTTESFYEYSQSDVTVGNFTAQVGDTLAFTSSTGLTIDGSSIPVVNPAATVTGSYKWWDASLSTWTPVSSYTITNLGVFGGGDTTVMIQEMISEMVN